MKNYLNNRIILGMMRLCQRPIEDDHSFLDKTYEFGVRYFDHADIYNNGQSEVVFGKWFSNKKISGSIKREDIIIQDKAGIIPGKAYNNSYDYLIHSVDNSLQRLNCDYLDNFLIHRPDILMEPDEIGKAFDELKSSGKVKDFGVSNFNSMQIDYLRTGLNVPIKFNQLQMSIAFAPMISENLETNTYSNDGLSRTMGVLDYCRKNQIEIQTWSPLQYGFFAGNFIDNPDYRNLNNVLARLAEKHHCSKVAIAMAWLLRLDRLVKVVSGTTNIDHLRDILVANRIKLTHEEFYELYMAAGYRLP